MGIMAAKLRNAPLPCQNSLGSEAEMDYTVYYRGLPWKEVFDIVWNSKSKKCITGTITYTHVLPPTHIYT